MPGLQEGGSGASREELASVVPGLATEMGGLEEGRKGKGKEERLTIEVRGLQESRGSIRHEGLALIMLGLQEGMGASSWVEWLTPGQCCL